MLDSPFVLALIAFLVLWVAGGVGYWLNGLLYEPVAAWLRIRVCNTWDKALRDLVLEEAAKAEAVANRDHECACRRAWPTALMAPGHTPWRCESAPGLGLLDPNAIYREDS